MLLAATTAFAAGWLSGGVQRAREAAEESSRYGRLYGETNDLNVEIEDLISKLKARNQIVPIVP